MASEQFILWAGNHRTEAAVVRELLRKPLSDQPVELRGQLVQVEAWNARITSLLADAESYLSEAEDREATAISDAKMSPPEKRLRMRCQTRHERRVRDTLQGMAQSLEHRMMLGMSLMKAHNSERMVAANGRL